MKKIVFNADFGGFSLTSEDEDLYAELSGFTLYRYEQVECRGAQFVKTKESVSGLGITAYTKDHGESFSVLPDANNPENGYWHWDDLERDDPVLVKIVEKNYQEPDIRKSALVIEEIPDDATWQIGETEDGDGQEVVEWWVD